MAVIITRAGKGSPLTNAELDANFNNINTQLSTAVITGGTIDGATIGATTATTGKFSQLDVDNLRLDANTISSTDTNGNITITPNGTGGVVFPAGTAALPAITTTGDTNTGIWFPAADTIAFTEGGVESMRIDSSGNVGIGVTPAAGQSLVVGKNITGAVLSAGTTVNGTIQSGVTSVAYGFRTNLSTVADTFTLANLRHHDATQGTFGAGSTVTNQSGFFVDNSLIGATNNFGFFGNIASAANRWNLYMAGTADNYMLGNLGIGTNAPTSGLQTAGSSSKSAFRTPNIAEVNTISATAATGTINYDVTTQSVLYYTTNASGNFTVNFRGSSGTTLNTVMQTGESISATFLVTNGATAYYNSVVQVDGSTVTPKWQGGTAPTSGNASSIDSYTYVIIKTGSATFTVLASVTKFA